jgi:hypothetical protein
MYERLLKQTERYLENRNEIAVPVKQLWDAMVKEGAKHNFTVPSLMSDFECLLEGDHRFEFVAERAPRAGRNPDIEELLEHEELEKLGFLNSQNVRLRRSSLLPFDDEDEHHDALDAAVSFEDLGENFPDSSLLDTESAPKVQKRPATISRILKKSGSASEGGKGPPKKALKPQKSAAKKKPAAKKGKK